VKHNLSTRSTKAFIAARALFVTLIICCVQNMPSDSNYSAVSRHTRRPQSKTKNALDVVDDAWAADKLSDDEVEISRHEAVVAPLLEEGELDADAIVVSPTGNSASAANNGKSSCQLWK
jgi:hypothetical protein